MGGGGGGDGSGSRSKCIFGAISPALMSIAFSVGLNLCFCMRTRYLPGFNAMFVLVTLFLPRGVVGLADRFPLRRREPAPEAVSA